MQGADRHIQGASAHVWGGSSVANRLEPSRPTAKTFCGEARCAGCLRTSSAWFTSNLLEPQHRSDTKVCSVFSPEGSVLRRYGFTEETRCAGCSYTRSGWFKRSEPPRIFSNHMMTELAGRVEVFHRSLGWFACTEPSLATSLQGK